MIRLPAFEQLQPRTLEEACHFLHQHEGEARLMAGGTDLLVRMKRKVTMPRCLIDLSHIPDLNYIDYDEKEGLKIGCMATLREIETSPIVRDKFSPFAEAAGSVGSRQLRNMGTLGGNLNLDTRCWYYLQSQFWHKCRPPCYKRGGDVCHLVKGGDHCYALFMADTVPALMALNTTLKVVGSQRERVLIPEELFTGNGKAPIALNYDEIITEIRIPTPAPYSGGTYLKLSQRDAIDFPTLGVGVMITLDSRDGACIEAKLASTAVGPAPLGLKKAGEVLRGEKINGDLIQEAARTASKEVSPISHMGVPATYKKEMVNVLVKRALNKSLERANAVIRRVH